MNCPAMMRAALMLTAVLPAAAPATDPPMSASTADSVVAAPVFRHDSAGPIPRDGGGEVSRRRAGKISANDTAEFALAPLVGLDIAWTLGSAPAFDLWQKNLPRSLASLSLPLFIHGVDGPGDADSARLRFAQKDEPATYNVDFPLGVSWTFLSEGMHGLTAYCSFALQRKYASATVTADSLNGKLRLQHSLALLWFGAGLTYTLAIPENYFSVDNTRRTALRIGVAASPLTYIRRNERLDTEKGTDDPLAAVGRMLAARLHEFSAYGWGVVWNAGLWSLRNISPTGGLVTTVGYEGRWQRFAGVVDNDLRFPGHSEGTRMLSQVCHRFALALSFVRGRKHGEKKSAAEPVGSAAPATSEAGSAPIPISGAGQSPAIEHDADLTKQ